VERQLDLLFDENQRFSSYTNSDDQDLSAYNTLSLHDYCWCVIRKTSAGIFSGERWMTFSPFLTVAVLIVDS
jgi:hypothetical protein